MREGKKKDDFLRVRRFVRVQYDRKKYNDYAFNGRYLDWMHGAATDLFEAAGVNAECFKMITQSFTAGDIAENLKNTIENDELIEIRADVDELGADSVHIRYEFLKNNSLLATGRAAYSCVDPASRKAIALSEGLKKKFMC